jgi:hypothetical protein
MGHRDAGPGKLVGVSGGKHPVPKLRGVQAVHAPRRFVIGTGEQVQVQAQCAALRHHMIRGPVELIDPVVQGATQGSW